MKKITKKLCAVLLACASSLAVMAQTDVTDLYLTNAGFDEAVTCDVDDDRNMATGDNVPTVIVPIEGWILDGDEPAWAVAATFAYGTSARVNGGSIPSTGYDGSETGGALGLSVGWGASMVYYQEVILPAGMYQLEYAVYNTNEAASQGTSKVGWVSSEGTSTLSGKTSFTAYTWETEVIDFTVLEETTGRIQIGLAAISGGTGANAKVCFDYIKLYSIEVDKGPLEDKIREAGEVTAFGSPGYEYMQGIISAAQAVLDRVDASVEEILIAIEDLDVAIVTYNDDSLVDLQVEGVTVAGFDADVLAYDYYTTSTDLLEVTATANGAVAGADVTITQAPSIPGVATVVVTSGKGYPIREYKVNFIFNYMAGWDAYGSNTQTPYDAGWRTTDTEIDDLWDTGGKDPDATKYQYRDNLSVGRVFIHPLNTEVFSYAVELEGGKAYQFTCSSAKMSGEGTRPTTFAANTAADASGTVLGSDTQGAAKWESYTNHSFSFVTSTDGIYYITWQTGTCNGDRSLAWDFMLVQTGNALVATFDTDGGIPVPPAQYFAPNSKIAEPEEPTKEGYIFDGWWYTDKDGISTRWDFDLPIESEEDVVIIARWKDPKGDLRNLIVTATASLDGGTERGIEYLQNAINAAQIVMDDDDATEYEIEDAYYDLRDAMTAYQNKRLSVLQIDGETIEGFSSSVYEYTYELSSDDDIPTVTATAVNELAEVTIDATTQIPGSTIVTVTAGDGSTQAYTVNFVSDVTSMGDVIADEEVVDVQYYTLSGMRVSAPAKNEFYIVKKIYASDRVEVVKESY